MTLLLLLVRPGLQGQLVPRAMRLRLLDLPAQLAILVLQDQLGMPLLSLDQRGRQDLRGQRATLQLLPDLPGRQD